MALSIREIFSAFKNEIEKKLLIRLKRKIAKVNLDIFVIVFFVAEIPNFCLNGRRGRMAQSWEEKEGEGGRKREGRERRKER